MSISRRGFLTAAGYGVVAGTLTGLLSRSCPGANTNPEKVLLIGIDGLRPDALHKAKTPNIDRLAVNGAYSFAAQTGEYTVSGPGWSNILTGVWEDKHGVKDNSFAGADYMHYPSIFTRIEEYKPKLKTCSITSLDWFNKYIITTADKRKYYPFENNGDKKVAKKAASVILNTKVDLLFAYFMGADMAGHSYGFDPQVPEYISAIETIDCYVGMLYTSVRARSASKDEKWLTIFTSDHGGKGKEHDGVGEEAKRVPLIMHGSAVQRGEIVPIPRQVDIAPTILTYFGIPVREEWELDGKVVGLKDI